MCTTCRPLNISTRYDAKANKVTLYIPKIIHKKMWTTWCTMLAGYPHFHSQSIYREGAFDFVDQSLSLFVDLQVRSNFVS